MKIQKRLFTFAGLGPENGYWKSHYLLCPYCKELLEKSGKNQHCKCGNLSVDGDMLRIMVLTDPNKTPTFNDAQGRSDNALSFEDIQNKEYEVEIKPEQTKIVKIFSVDLKEFIVLEDYYGFTGRSNLYIVKKGNLRKINYLELKSSNDYYVAAQYFGQTYIEATTLNHIHYKIDLKSKKIIDSEIEN